MQQILSMSLGVDIAALFSLLPSLAALFNPQLHSERRESLSEAFQRASIAHMLISSGSHNSDCHVSMQCIVCFLCDVAAS